MSPSLLRTAAALLVLALATPPAPAAPTLAPFRDEAALTRTLDARHARALARAGGARRSNMLAVDYAPPPPPPAMAVAAPALQLAAAKDVASAAEPGITNNQVQGVDEGDIVKRAGDFLVVLRRGRLFTLRVGGDRLDATTAVDAFGPGIEPSGTWYDEMLVSERSVVVIGYSYARGGTEVGVFDLDANGGLRHRDTYQLRSNDYYSSRNYASRLVGRNLVFYSPMALDPWSDWRAALPAQRHWIDAATPPAFRRILPATRIYRGTDDIGDDATLHTVSICPLDRAVLACHSTAVLGGPGRVFHVAEDAVYVWTSGARNARGTPMSTLFRLPLDGGAPSALRAWGIPVDTQGFLQKDGWLNVLVGRDGDGEGMGPARGAGGDLALLRVPLSAFGDGEARADRSRYRILPGTSGWNMHQRFVGDWLLYGDDASAGQQVHALRYASAAPVQTFPLPHALERIEALGRDAVLVGNDERGLVFTAMHLAPARAALAHAFRLPGARQGDDRSHGFFYRPLDAGTGLLGLPVLQGDAGASVLYLRNRSLVLSPLGALDARQDPSRDDRCRASCVDWYGNARPIFLGDRVFALMGYELVEGRIDGAAIHERRRVDFAPRMQLAD